MPDLEPAEVLRRLGGQATLADLTRWTTRHQVRAALAAGRIERATRGCYALAGLPPAEMVAARARGVVSHLTAAERWGVPLLCPSGSVHVTVPHGARPIPCDAVQYHHRTLAADETIGRFTAPLRTLLDCATVLPFAEALSIADGGLRAGLVRPAALRKAADASLGPGRARRRRVAAAADARAANPLESGLRAIVLDAGIRTFQPQLAIRLPDYTVHADLGDPERRLALEAEGFAYHGSRPEFLRDCQRYTELTRHGWLVLRFSWEDVLFRGAWVAEVIWDTMVLRAPPFIRPNHRIAG